MKRTSIAAAMVLVAGAAASAGAASKKECLLACAARIEECATQCDVFGDLRAACKKKVLKRCRTDGVETCASSSSSSTTSTTLGSGGSTTSTTIAGPTATLTLKNYLSWCSVSVNGDTASTTATQMLTFPQGTVVDLAGDKASATFVWGYWVGTDGDTGPSHDTSMSTMVTMSGDKTVQACCPFASSPGTPCPPP